MNRTTRILILYCKTEKHMFNFTIVFLVIVWVGTFGGASIWLWEVGVVQSQRKASQERGPSLRMPMMLGLGGARFVGDHT